MPRIFGGLNGYGYHKDPDGHMATSAHVLLGVAASAPKSYSLKGSVKQILNQLQTSSCTGQATKGAISTRMSFQGIVIPEPSQSGIYKIGRAIDRVPDSNGILPSLQDDGAMPNQIIRGISEWGVPSENVDSFNPSTINDEPDMAEFESASHCKLDGAYRINCSGTRRLDYIKTAISSGYPPCCAVQVDSEFENYNGVGTLSDPDPNDLLGGHYIYMVAYDTLVNGQMIVEIVNSWGEDWGDYGFARGDEKFIAGMSDIYVMNVKLRTDTNK